MYRPAIVTFMDILGFREIIAKMKPDEINEILEIVEQTITPDEAIPSPHNPKVIVFSDSIVRARIIDTKENMAYPIGLVFSELYELVHVQSELIQAGILIRGGITLGDICINKNRIFGPAMVRAYSLENKFAKFPRLIVDPSLIKEYKTNKLLRRDGHSLKMESGYVKELIRQSDDGLWFVDYLTAIQSEFDEPETSPEFLYKHKEIIINKSPKIYEYNNDLAKYVWLANYHNTIINEVDEKWFKYYDIERDDFLINSEELPALQYM